MLLTTACSSEDVAPVAEQESLVSFTVELPAEVQSRAYGQALQPRKLYYQVFAKDGESLTQLPQMTEAAQATVVFSAGELSKTIQLRLANSRQYAIVFWAAHDDAPYAFDHATGKVTIDYVSAAKPAANSDIYDAFFARKDVSVSGTINETVELRRPFAQINIGATDATEAAAAGWETDNTSVKVDNVYSTLSLIDGSVDGLVSGGYTYTLAAKPAGETFPATTTPVAEYQSMVYVLTRADQSLVDVEFKAEDNGDVITRTYANVPVKRNYRTNIYGRILTEEANFTIEIKPGFKTPANDYAVPEPGTAMVNGVQYTTLQEAVTAASASGTKVEVTVGAGSYTMPTIPTGKEVTLKGQGAGVTTIALPLQTGNYSNLTLANTTVAMAETNNAYTGIVHTPNVTLDGARVVGMIATYAPNFKAVNTTFVSGDGYCVHIYGAGTATFENCKFESTSGKAVYCHDEGSVPVHHDIIFTDCTFNSTVAITNAENPLKSKAPVQLHTELSSCGTLTMTRCTATGFGDPHQNGDLWNEIHNAGTVHATTKFTITIDGTVVQTAH